MTNKYGGLEIMYSVAYFNGGASIIKTDILGVPDYYAKSVYTPSAIWLYVGQEEIGGSIFVVCKTYVNGAVIDRANFDLQTPAIDELEYRVVFSNATITVECNGANVYTYIFSEVDWPDVASASMTSVGNNDYGDIVVSELRDPREAVYIDYEQNTASAIESIIQQRPVQQIPETDREISFTYSAVKDIVSAHHISSYDETTRDNQQLSSDGLVYYNDVAISISLETAKQIGLKTKLYRLSELFNGALYASQRTQELALERRKSISIVCRLDLRLQIADRLIVDNFLIGTNTHLEDDIIIENIGVQIQNGNYAMNITGRRNF